MNGPDRGTTDLEDIVATDPPTVDNDGVPSKCLSFIISSDWGHFRRIDRTVTKQTYRLPPRTTLAGILAAITGAQRDSYYDVFEPERSAVAVTPKFDIRTVTKPTLGLGTDPDETFASAGGTGRKTIQVNYPDSTDNRQIHSYELLVEPSYRVDVAVEDPEFYGTLRQRLETGRSYYTPSMGLSEYLAWVEPVGDSGEPMWEFDPERDTATTVAVDSAVPEGTSDIIPSSGETYRTERMPAFMEAHAGGRRTTGYATYSFRLQERDSIELRPDTVTPVTVGEDTVVFH